MTLNKKFDEADKVLEHMTKQQEKELVKAYQKSLKEIRGKVALAYEKHGASFVEMQKYNRLTRLEKDIGEEIRILTGKNAMTLRKGIIQTYQESFYTTAYTIESEAQAKLGFTQLSEKATEEVIMNKLERIGWKDRNKENQKVLVRQIREELAQGLIQGKAYQDTARKIKERMDIGATKALRIAHTETHRAQSRGRLDSIVRASEKGVKMVKVWVSSLDDATRDAHQELDGKKIGIKENFESDNGGQGEAPGELGTAADDINCRCTLRAEIEGYEPKVRRARGEGVIPYTTYKDWKKNRIRS